MAGPWAVAAGSPPFGTAHHDCPRQHQKARPPTRSAGRTGPGCGPAAHLAGPGWWQTWWAGWQVGESAGIAAAIHLGSWASWAPFCLSLLASGLLDRSASSPGAPQGQQQPTEPPWPPSVTPPAPAAPWPTSRPSWTRRQGAEGARRRAPACPPPLAASAHPPPCRPPPLIAGAAAGDAAVHGEEEGEAPGPDLQQQHLQTLAGGAGAGGRQRVQHLLHFSARGRGAQRARPADPLPLGCTPSLACHAQEAFEKCEQINQVT